jgi:ubiquinone/menaquinone biosynthesis C-methylase UbiE
MDFFKVKESKITYTEIPQDGDVYTATMDKKYAVLAKYYDFAMTPLWRNWLKKAIPFIEGSKVLEVSFGTGYLMAQYAEHFDTYGIDLNDAMIQITKRKLEKKGLSASISKGKVENLPFGDRAFDTIVNTMAFTGYPDGEKALDEMRRVLKNNGKLLLMDFDYPADRNIIGYSLVKIGEKYGDVMKDLKRYLERSGFEYRETYTGGFGSVYLFVCTKA